MTAWRNPDGTRATSATCSAHGDPHPLARLTDPINMDTYRDEMPALLAQQRQREHLAAVLAHVIAGTEP